MRQALFTLLFLCVSGIHLQAQPVFTPRNMALGGGGSTYLTDYHTNFYNPANLMIQDREGSFSFGIGTGSFLLGGMRNYSNLNDQIQNARDYTSTYNPTAAAIDNAQREEFLEKNYPGNTLISDKRSRYEATVLGMKWQRNDKAFSIAVRTRTASNYGAGKGWYANQFENIEGRPPTYERSLVHRFQRLHEISLGYAESFQFLTNLTPRLDNFVIGIAPKFVIGGSYLNANWTNFYENNNGNLEYIESFSYDASGEFGASTAAYSFGSTADAANAEFTSNDYFDVNGFGAGLDIGITYLLTLGNDLSAVRPNQQPTQKSLRLSFSMTDIGFVSYNTDEISYSIKKDTTVVSSVPGNLADEYFIGSQGQYLHFVQEFASVNPFLGTTPERGGFSTLLPMAIHGGALLEINRLKLMGDVSIGLTNSAFNSPKAISSAGIEIRPFTFLPLRGGIQFKAQRPEFISLGMAIETRYWDLSLATQFTPDSFSSAPVVTGVSAATLQFHF